MHLLCFILVCILKSYVSYLCLVFAIPFFLYALLVSSNSIIAAALMIYYVMRIVKAQCKKIYVFIVSCILLICLFYMGKGFNNCILDVEETNPTSVMQIDEIAATSYIEKNFF